MNLWPLAETLTAIATASLTLEYFSKRFRCAEIIILTKSGKTDKVLYILGVYRPIALLSSINKIIEKTVGERIAVITKKYSLLPQG
jgi:hypothetical protein